PGGERHGPGPRPDEAGHTRRVAHDVPGVVVHVHADHQVAREDPLLHHLLLAALELDHVLDGDDDLEDLVLHVHGADPGVEVGLHLVLVAGIGVHDVPVTRTLGGRDELLLVVGGFAFGLGVGIGGQV